MDCIFIHYYFIVNSEVNIQWKEKFVAQCFISFPLKGYQGKFPCVVCVRHCFLFMFLKNLYEFLHLNMFKTYSWCMYLTCENIVYTSPCCLSPFVSNVRFSIIRPCDLCSIHAHANCTWIFSLRIWALFIDTTCLDIFVIYVHLCWMSMEKYCCIVSYCIEPIDNDVIELLFIQDRRQTSI